MKLGFALTAAVLVSGCAPAASFMAAPAPVVIQSAREEEPDPAIEPALPSTGILVWTRGSENMAAVTHWLVPDPRGELREEARFDGVVIAVSGGLHRYVVEDHETDTYSCESMETDTPVVSGKGKVQRALLERVGDRHQTEIVSAPRAELAQEYDHHVSLAGSVGKYLFVRDSSYDYSCGAHGGSSASFVLFDAEQGKAVELLDAEERSRLDQEERARAAEALSDEEMGEPKKPEDVALAMLQPSYDQRGRLEIEYLFHTFACYACGDGEWGSYTRSTFVSAKRVPRALSAFASPPAQLSRWLRVLPSTTVMGGWSVTAGTSAEQSALATLSARSRAVARS